jgi:hypothetical protein
LIRPDPDNMSLASEADELLQEIIRPTLIGTTSAESPPTRCRRPATRRRNSPSVSPVCWDGPPRRI